MTSIDFTAPEWPTWTPISGGLANIKGCELPTDVAEADLPVMATNDQGEFIRSEVLGWWFRCNWAGHPVDESDPETPPMPGVLKLRVQLTDRIVYTAICAPVLVWNMPHVGVPYRKVADLYEWPDGSKRIGGTWYQPGDDAVIVLSAGDTGRLQTVLSENSFDPTDRAKAH